MKRVVSLMMVPFVSLVLITLFPAAASASSFFYRCGNLTAIPCMTVAMVKFREAHGHLPDVCTYLPDRHRVRCSDYV